MSNNLFLEKDVLGGEKGLQCSPIQSDIQSGAKILVIDLVVTLSDATLSFNLCNLFNDFMNCFNNFDIIYLIILKNCFNNFNIITSNWTQTN